VAGACGAQVIAAVTFWPDFAEQGVGLREAQQAPTKSANAKKLLAQLMCRAVLRELAGASMAAALPWHKR
jgi:hypothetical protein